MLTQPNAIPRRTVGEWSVTISDNLYRNPFTDVQVHGEFTSPSGVTHNMPGFYDGGGTWRVRFNPAEEGGWHYRIVALPTNSAIHREGVFEVVPSSEKGFLQATPGLAWGFSNEAGDPVFLLGDTNYNLFGAAHCDLDVEQYLRRRISQGFNFVRVRLQVSPFHPPEGYSHWQTRRTWPWGGSEQSPQLDRFNLDWFSTVDRVVALAESIGLGLEMVMEAWGFEFPFNNRAVFTAEWEELWLRYLIARYDAFNSVYFWTLMNEYEYYPDGVLVNKPTANQWAIRVARWMKATAPHRHIIAVHNGPSKPPLAERFSADPEAVDCVLFQEWGTISREDAWLAAGIENVLQASLANWAGSAIFAEYAYETSPHLPLTFPAFAFCDENHTRRGAWRGACSGLCIANGFDNTWGPHQILDEDQPGVHQLALIRDFFVRRVPFADLRQAADFVVTQATVRGHQPLALTSPSFAAFVVYLPVGGQVEIKLLEHQCTGTRWYDPRTGMDQPAHPHATAAGTSVFTAPPGDDPAGRPLDWVLFKGNESWND